MKKSAITLLCVLAAAAAWAAPAVTWLATGYDFGVFDEDDGPVTCEFRFVNTGDAPLTVLSARASCGCTQPVVPREAVAPGDTAAIIVSYNPAGRPGRFNKSVTVETDGTPAKTRLTVRGVVIGSQASVAGRYPVDRGALKFRNPGVIFGTVTKPHLKTEFAEAYNRSADSLRLRVVSKPRYIDINFEPKVVAPGEQISVICYLRSSDDSLWGLVEDSIRLSTGAEEFSLPFTAQIKEDFSRLSAADLEKAPVARLSDNSLDFGSISRADGLVSQSLTLTDAGRQPLVVRRVYSADRGVTATIDRATVKHGKSSRLTVTVDPSLISGDMLNARVTLITNDPANPVQTIRVVGTIH